MNAPIIEWTGECVMAFIDLGGGAGTLRFNKYGADRWYAEALELEGGGELKFDDPELQGEASPPVPTDTQLTRVLDAALDRLLWKGDKTISLREHAEQVHAQHREESRRHAEGRRGAWMPLDDLRPIYGERA